MFNPFSNKKNFTVGAKSAEKKKFFDFDKNWYLRIFEVTYYKFALKLWKLKMADQNVKIYLIGWKINTRLIFNFFTFSSHT